MRQICDADRRHVPRARSSSSRDAERHLRAARSTPTRRCSCPPSRACPRDGAHARTDRRRRRRPLPDRPPSGCVFHPRCPRVHAGALRRRGAAARADPGDSGHVARCHYPLERWPLSERASSATATRPACPSGLTRPTSDPERTMSGPRGWPRLCPLSTEARRAPASPFERTSPPKARSGGRRYRIVDAAERKEILNRYRDHSRRFEAAAARRSSSRRGAVIPFTPPPPARGRAGADGARDRGAPARRRRPRQPRDRRSASSSRRRPSSRTSAICSRSFRREAEPTP